MDKKRVDAMDETFKSLVDGLHEKYRELISMEPLTIDMIPADCPVGGVYLFSESAKHLYVGRTKRSIKIRLKNHVGTACPFAWRLAREQTGAKPSYKKEGSQNELLREPRFKEALESAKQRIKKMDVRFVGEPDPKRQALLEIYVAVVSKAEYNDFGTT